MKKIVHPIAWVLVLLTIMLTGCAKSDFGVMNNGDSKVEIVAENKMLIICRRMSPVIFKDAGPGCVTGSCPEKASCGRPRRREEWDGGADKEREL